MEQRVGNARDMKPAAPRTINAMVTRAVMTTSISQIAVIVLSFATSIGQARLLGADGRGDLARFANAGALAVLYVGLGLNAAITYFVASGAVQPRPLLRSLRPVFAVSVLAVIAGVVVAAGTGLERFLPQGLPIAWVVALLALFFAMSQASGWFSAVLAARGDFSPINISAVTVAAVSAAASIVLLVLAPTWVGAWTFIAMLTALEGLRAAMLAFSASRRDRLGSTGNMPAVAVTAATAVGFMGLWRYSGLSFLGDAMQFMTYRFDQWVVDANRGAADLGRYALAVSLAQLVWIVPTATARVMFPYAAMMDRSDAALLAWRAARVALVVSASLAAIGWVGSQLFLTALFGEQFAEVPSLLGILLLGVVPYSVAKVLGNYMAGINALGVTVSASGAVLVITIALDLLLIPSIGAAGAAWATTISYSLYTLLLFAVFVRRSPLSLRTALSWRLPESASGSAHVEDERPPV
jgi:O-antigen/teichoic acid export membrane protein